MNARPTTRNPRWLVHYRPFMFIPVACGNAGEGLDADPRKQYVTCLKCRYYAATGRLSPRTQSAMWEHIRNNGSPPPPTWQP